MLYELKTPDYVHSDERGTLKQLFSEGFRQVNVITSRKGVVRGGHYHVHNTEAFYIISGSGKVVLSKDGCEETYAFEKGSYFQIGQGVVHTFSFTEDTVLVSMYSLGVEMDGREMDIISA